MALTGGVLLLTQAAFNTTQLADLSPLGAELIAVCRGYGRWVNQCVCVCVRHMNQLTEITHGNLAS